ncbi:hypothetical protein PR002_g24809 [Phytophthora rubi]|uniref:Uncharacterized protein n=1 Tax=Phytophthora rubi TaxID=129364 RepID=A0A6A3ICL4_9STRA|nr:hypothetical protein PR002_g24809 [Phytophthora rubi]
MPPAGARIFSSCSRAKSRPRTLPTSSSLAFILAPTSSVLRSGNTSSALVRSSRASSASSSGWPSVTRSSCSCIIASM